MANVNPEAQGQGSHLKNGNRCPGWTGGPWHTGDVSNDLGALRRSQTDRGALLSEDVDAVEEEAGGRGSMLCGERLFVRTMLRDAQWEKRSKCFFFSSVVGL